MRDIYGIPAFQKKELKELCLGSCGKIIVGALTCDDIEFAPCDIKECPHEEKNKRVGKIELADGERVIFYIRKLKLVQEKP